MTVTLAVLQHEPATGLGRFGDLLDRWGVDHEVLWTTRGPLPDPEGFAGVLALGGSLGADDPRLQGARRWIRDAVSGGVPYLGICLGGQLLASALGAPVRPARPEIGVHRVFLTDAAREDPLFRGMPWRLVAFGFHGDGFALPSGAVPLAGSLACTFQAFRYGASAYAFQFHPEVRPNDLERWRQVPSYRRLLGQSGRDWSEVSSELEGATQTLDRLAAHLLERWVAVTSGVEDPPVRSAEAA